MSRHVSRKERWAQQTPSRHTSDLGEVVYQQQAWYGVVNYRIRLPEQRPGEVAVWEDHRLQLGPFKRPRNAMVAVEREVTLLRNRHGADFLLAGQTWADG